MDTPYSGDISKLVICIDIGTTQTGVSIIHLQPELLPKLRVVSRWPGDGTSAKIPTLVLYHQGVAKAFGAEAAKDEKILEQASAEGWEAARWFKLSLHNSSMQPPAYSESSSSPQSSSAMEIPPLPSGVTLSKVYEDWIGYVIRSTQSWFVTNVPDGDTIWEKLSSSITYVLAHPNAYTLKEQSVLRSALCKAIHMPQGIQDDRIVFVTEGEASVHFSLSYAGQNSSDWIKPGAEFLVLDAGGSTVDTCVYVVDAVLPKLKLKEAKTSGCVQAGAIFPTREARAIISDKLNKSKYGRSEYLDAIVAEFDTKTKCIFKTPDDSQIIKFGFERDTDKSCGVSRGRLTLSGTDVERAFAPTISHIMASVEQQVEGRQVKHILLTGGFGESPYLQKCLREKYEPLGMKVVSADEPSTKAVAEGAGLFFVKESVVARATRFAFGSAVSRPEDRWFDEIHNRRVFMDLDGKRYVSGGWSKILDKGLVIESDQVMKEGFFIRREDNFVHKNKLWIAKTDPGAAGWVVDLNGRTLPNFEVCCTVEADLTPLCVEKNRRTGPDGDTYYELSYWLCLFFGGTSLKSCIMFIDENGVEKKGPASVVPMNYF